MTDTSLNRESELLRFALDVQRAVEGAVGEYEHMRGSSEIEWLDHADKGAVIAAALRYDTDWFYSRLTRLIPTAFALYAAWVDRATGEELADFENDYLAEVAMVAARSFGHVPQDWVESATTMLNLWMVRRAAEDRYVQQIQLQADGFKDETV